MILPRQPFFRTFPNLALCLGNSLILLTTDGADTNQPWRLNRGANLPEWLEIGGECRLRYEVLDSQFRVGQVGGDQAMALRTLILTQLKAQPGRLVVEMLDARHYLQDSGSSINNTMVNPFDILQAHFRWDAGDLIPGGTNTVRVGRETLDLGQRRLIARNAFRNTINSFTGIDWLWSADGGGTIRTFYLLPVRRLPEGSAALLDNDLEWDTQSFDQQFYGVYGELPKLPGKVRVEAYYLRLKEEADYDLRDRQLHSPGLRIFRSPVVGQWDLEFESTYQFGQSRLGADLRLAPLNHEAFHAHVTLGYTIESPWQPRIGVRYDYASGDGDPTDGNNGRFDTLFGARRFEFGPTGIYGAVPRANLNSPEYSFALKPVPHLDLSLSHRLLWLAEARDVWAGTGVRDAGGAAGTELGHQLELRVRWEFLPGNVRLEAGYVHFFNGSFLEHAPNATRQGDVNYSFSEFTFSF